MLLEDHLPIVQDIVTTLDPGVRAGAKAVICYLAGFFDGEGTVCLASKGKAGSIVVQIAVGNICREPLERFEQSFGGKITLVEGSRGDGGTGKPAHRRPYYKWTLSGAAAETCLALMYPTLIVKRPMVDVIREYREGIIDLRTGGLIAIQEQARRAALKEKLGRLNRGDAGYERHQNRLHPHKIEAC